ncbi:MAG: hypothetical protein ACLQNE_46475 [Thermoguttaceae bacterium]
MSPFPAVDPIPLPAPVWLFKVLGVLTMALHFYAVEMLLGGLLVAAWLALLARGRSGSLRLSAATVLAGRLPIVMTYVINLGVPSLLFAQVLYGRAIYTSSVLIGAWWIAVIPLLMLCYWLLYRFSAALERGRAAWWLGAGAWLVAGSIAKIYSTNMTLMLRPEVWQSMYAASPTGTHLPPADPTLMWRWIFMLSGGLVFGGLWMVWLAGCPRFDAALRDYLKSRGGMLAAAAMVAQLVAAHFVFYNQPESVQTALAGSMLCRIAGYAWFAAAGLVLAFGVWAGFTRPAMPITGWLGAGAGFLAVTTMTLYRDGLRDLTLLGKGFDVWDRAVVTNWGVVVLFLVLFVVGLALVGWLITVMMRAEPVSQKAA